ncbi:Marine sediment metagenome DNA, contig: S03H2_L04701 OS=marine sediment metagenome GN=S03H2_18785 PE=4 SV=1 [Gemmata massiliana]|uniref:Marine sediment metagenome DNA, contig: S03H2_L04701 n=1 Tax=Gemmata massiliana TaxID=1210884 RepID=A0A6P2D278_9BACT|nr:hypothetical protein [Gemmata massiliana]VTR95239.1 Marine sediment metagenome DNA, contig: S03H2_L04701 OS=marine sediment metagenome GN=S03H2_18785 PE=4 SV=1 [Gemmata massiliana]
MPQNVDYSDVLHTGTHKFEVAPVVPANSFGDTQIGSSNPIGATKLAHQYVPTYSQPNGTAAVTERKVIHVAQSAGNVISAEAGIVTVAAGAATVTVDVRKNGTTVLTSTISISVAQAAFAKVSGAVNATPATYVTGDVFEVVVTATAGGGTLPQGLFVDVKFREGAG